MFGYTQLLCDCNYDHLCPLLCDNVSGGMDVTKLKLVMVFILFFYYFEV